MTRPLSILQVDFGVQLSTDAGDQPNDGEQLDEPVR